MLALTSACASLPPENGPPSLGDFPTRLAAPGGFEYEEARQFIEFCVDLDDQDDPSISANIDPTQWQKIYDSRQALADDYFKYRKQPASSDGGTQPGLLPDDNVKFWRKVFGRIESDAMTAKPVPIALHDPGDIESHPSLNGFGPWQNAWALYKGLGPNVGRYVIAIRGTVFSDKPSAVENGLFQPVNGHNFLFDGVSFSERDDATVHSGFAHATFSLLFDLRYGILPVILNPKSGVPPKSVLYIVGHSQGAAIATLVHAFLFNAIHSADVSGADPFGLEGMDYRMKSYDFAQPKPGNYAFSAEFARYTQGPGNAIVINNDLDPVPQLPFTIQSMADLEGDFHGKFLLARAVYAAGAVGKWLRRGLSDVLEWRTVGTARGYGHYYRWKYLSHHGRRLRSGSSWGFVPAGRVILVYGTPQPNQSKDVFFQHHATTYRALIEQQLATSR